MQGVASTFPDRRGRTSNGSERSLRTAAGVRPSETSGLDRLAFARACAPERARPSPGPETYYKPGVEATANLLAELCEALADEYDVTVVTGRLRPYPDLPHDEVLNGVRVIRTRSTAFDRTAIHHRAANYFTFLAGSLLRAVTLAQPHVVMTLTDPPMIGDIGLAVARRFGVPLLVVSEDVFPEIAVELKRLENPMLVALLRGMVNLYIRRAGRVVAIGETMQRRLETKGGCARPHHRDRELGRHDSHRPPAP